jgi:hypothetical protein
VHPDNADVPGGSGGGCACARSRPPWGRHELLVKCGRRFYLAHYCTTVPVQ